ncbi:MAG: hypothetical protein AAF809_07235 [Bacteroidota bacterium]
MGSPEVLTLRRLAPLACARVGVGAGLVLGVIVGVLLALTVPVVTTFWSDFAEVQAGAILVALVLVPLGSAVAGGVSGWVFALVFNATTRWTGGLRVVVERPAETRAQAATEVTVPDEASW